MIRCEQGRGIMHCLKNPKTNTTPPKQMAMIAHTWAHFNALSSISRSSSGGKSKHSSCSILGSFHWKSPSEPSLRPPPRSNKSQLANNKALVMTDDSKMQAGDIVFKVDERIKGWRKSNSKCLLRFTYQQQRSSPRQQALQQVQSNPW
jgi:hypothetical protein